MDDRMAPATEISQKHVVWGMMRRDQQDRRKETARVRPDPFQVQVPRIGNVPPNKI
jgi:hypothetical protein